jgi:hypothetical protein
MLKSKILVLSIQVLNLILVESFEIEILAMFHVDYKTEFNWFWIKKFWFCQFKF